MQTPVLSYSAIKDYKTCAYRFYETRILKNYRQAPTDATVYGERLHKAAEDYVKDGTELPGEFRFLKPTVDALLRKPGDKYPELKMAVNIKREPCAWDAQDAWIRGIADLVIVNEEKELAHVIDYKSGNDKYADTEQLRLMALMVFAHFPAVQRVKGALLFVVKDRIYKTKHARGDVLKGAGWLRIAEDAARISASLVHNQWPPTQSGLCKKHCPVSSCVYNGA
jgi:RecB family exonuclease